MDGSVSSELKDQKRRKRSAKPAARLAKSAGQRRTTSSARKRTGSKKAVSKKRVRTRAKQPQTKQRLDALQEKILRAIETRNPEEILQVLRIDTEEPQELSYDHRNFAYRELLQHFRTPTQKEILWQMTRYCAARPELVARQLACAVLDVFWKDRQPEAERLLLNLARDEDWEVREYAAATMARIVRKNFRANSPYIRRWAENPDPSIRRQVLIAVVAISDGGRSDWAEALLQVVASNLRDRDPYIRRNLGPYALGEGLLRHYPDETLEAMRNWARHKDEMVRWNVGMGLTSPWVKGHWEEALQILKSIGADKRRNVWQAVSAALQNLLRLHPEEVEPRMQEWMRERGLRVAVSTALAASQKS
ncbi:MAG: hypothetical protein GF355_06825 [Candidatus Eisenbacteria bacterium]|nr:hypothetical protein [Candidatus Eisenbacteria bacterium]